MPRRSRSAHYNNGFPDADLLVDDRARRDDGDEPVRCDNGSGISIDGFNSKELVTVTNGGTTIVDAGARLVLDGANRLAAGSRLDLEGGMLQLVDVNGANGQEFAAVSLGRDSAIDLGESSLTFDALGRVVAGTTLSVTDYRPRRRPPTPCDSSAT